jgi:hypothetical protein
MVIADSYALMGFIPRLWYFSIVVWPPMVGYAKDWNSLTANEV